jgi:hypothetical protein
VSYDTDAPAAAEFDGSAEFLVTGINGDMHNCYLAYTPMDNEGLLCADSIGQTVVSLSYNGETPQLQLGNGSAEQGGPAYIDMYVPSGPRERINALPSGVIGIANGLAQLTVAFTVSTLPSASSVGANTMALVTDSMTFTPGTCTGGGGDYMIAVSNGTTWSCH